MGVIFWPNLDKGRNEPDGKEENGGGDCRPLDFILADGKRAHRLFKILQSGSKV